MSAGEGPGHVHASAVRVVREGRAERVQRSDRNEGNWQERSSRVWMDVNVEDSSDVFGCGGCSSQLVPPRTRVFKLGK